MLKLIMERRAALKASLEALNAATSPADGEARSFTPDEATQFDAGLAELATMDARITELQAVETREAVAGAHRVQVVPAESRVQVVNEPNPIYRRDSATTSYFKDILEAPKDSAARARLAASQETRAGDTTSAATFAPPLWLVEDFVKLARAGRVTADLMQHEVLPGGVSSINLPKISGGTTVAIQQTNNTAVSNTDVTTTSVSSGVVTIAGQQVISKQLLAQSGIPFDRVILGDLAFAYAAALDTQVIAGTGANGQLRGLEHGASVGTTAYTTTTPAVVSVTSANSFYNRIVAAQNTINTARFLPAEAIVMSPRRWAWVLEALDTTNRPLVLPNGATFNAIASGDNAAQGTAGTLLGLPVYVDPNITTNLGVATNQDEVFVLRPSDCWLYETALESNSFEATYANNLSVLFVVNAYAAFIPDRFGPSVNIIGGTGLVAPTL